MYDSQASQQIFEIAPIGMNACITPHGLASNFKNTRGFAYRSSSYEE